MSQISFIYNLYNTNLARIEGGINAQFLGVSYKSGEFFGLARILCEINFFLLKILENIRKRLLVLIKKD